MRVAPHKAGVVSDSDGMIRPEYTVVLRHHIDRIDYIKANPHPVVFAVNVYGKQADFTAKSVVANQLVETIGNGQVILPFGPRNPFHLNTATRALDTPHGVQKEYRDAPGTNSNRRTGKVS
jgi:hypothetical protein